MASTMRLFNDNAFLFLFFRFQGLQQKRLSLDGTSPEIYSSSKARRGRWSVLFFHGQVASNYNRYAVLRFRTVRSMESIRSDRLSFRFIRILFIEPYLKKLPRKTGIEQFLQFDSLEITGLIHFLVDEKSSLIGCKNVALIFLGSDILSMTIERAGVLISLKALNLSVLSNSLDRTRTLGKQVQVCAQRLQGPGSCTARSSFKGSMNSAPSLRSPQCITLYDLQPRPE